MLLTKSRVLFWLNNSKGGWSSCLEDWWDNLRRLLSKKVDGCLVVRSPLILESAVETVNFSIVGVRVGDKAGCGGVLSNEAGTIRAIFLGPTEEKGREFSVLIALQVALESFLLSAWRGKAALVVRTDSKLVQNWVNDFSLCPWCWWPLLLEIKKLMKDVGSVQICYCPKMECGLAGVLVVDGSNRANMFKAWR
ncbi:hypothetical protein V6N13_113768 [Hibiscus sabdariffa]|uniref:RNase H type-1 domain-containing protein n=1 Tax=Hibiscus sabdariffa TaxID=183260 RepID=A0ABR2TZS8_9ROSI